MGGVRSSGPPTPPWLVGRRRVGPLILAAVAFLWCEVSTVRHQRRSNSMQSPDPGVEMYGDPREGQGRADV